VLDQPVVFSSLYPAGGFMTHPLRRFFLFLVAPVLLLAAGCSDTPTSPPAEGAAQAPLFNQGGGGPDVSRLATFNQRPSIQIAWARQWIGPEGGRLDYHGFAIDVPAGAVDRVTQFSIRLPVDPHGSGRVVAEFGPHGASFAVPVSIEFPFAGTSLEARNDPTIVWWNDRWVDMGATVTGNGARLRTTTDHFSTFGTAERGGVLVSGG
jgi:hypothetical protein